MSVTVNDVVKMADRLAPFSLAESWDNVGLLVGDRETVVRRILVAMDLTEEVLEEAILGGFQMIITHHPILFRGIKNVTMDHYEGRLLNRMIRHNIAMCACHTNFDKAVGGTNDALADIALLGEREALIPEPEENVHGVLWQKGVQKPGMGRIGKLFAPPVLLMNSAAVWRMVSMQR